MKKEREKKRIEHNRELRWTLGTTSTRKIVLPIDRVKAVKNVLEEKRGQGKSTERLLKKKKKKK